MDNRVSVILHTYYRYEPLENVLNALSGQTVDPYEVVISDQTPLSERPEGFYGRFPKLNLVINNLEHPSHAPAQNIGVKASSGNLLLFLDDDMEFSDDFIKSHVDVLNEEHVDVVFGAVSEKENLPDSIERDPTWMDPLSYFLKSPKKKWDGMILITHGGNTLIKRDHFLAVGGYDEKIPRMADIELGYRLFLNGAKMFYSQRPFAIHRRWSSGGTRKTQKDIKYLRLVSRIYLYKKHFPGWTTRQFFLKEVLGAFLFREFVSGKFVKKNILKPYYPLASLLKLLKANREAKGLFESKQQPIF